MDQYLHSVADAREGTIMGTIIADYYNDITIIAPPLADSKERIKGTK